MRMSRVGRQLTFRDIFTDVATFFALLALLIRIRWPRQELISRFVVAQ